MLKFKEFNNNPKNRKTGDCSTRAISKVLDIPYEKVLMLQCDAAIKTCYGITDKQVIEYILKQFGFVKQKMPKKDNGKRYMVKELDKILTTKQIEEGVLVTIAGHHTCIKDGYLLDIWDCSESSVCNYYTKA